eukprot:NODE_42_length_29671_cov_0.584810.p21 type:complete len:111 gc:universal NODE_42_length_29671_cov_0.584810:12370-12038(-)
MLLGEMLLFFNPALPLDPVLRPAVFVAGVFVAGVFEGTVPKGGGITPLGGNGGGEVTSRFISDGGVEGGAVSAVEPVPDKSNGSALAFFPNTILSITRTPFKNGSFAFCA